ncbi:MAG: ABC transporter ATP-binding protein [Flavobacteriaceae bacterium]
MEYIKKLSVFILDFKKYGILNIISNIFYAIFSTLAMVSLMPMINVLFGESPRVTQEPSLEELGGNYKVYFSDYINYLITKTTIDQGAEKALLYLIITIISMFLLKNLFSYLGLYFITFLKNGVLKNLRNAIYSKIVTLPVSYYSEKKKGDILSRISDDVNQVQNSLLAILELIIKEPLQILFAIITMFLISVKLTVFVFLFIPIAGAIISRIGKSLKKNSDRVQREQGVFLSTLEETLGGLKIIKSFNAEKKFNSKFNNSTERFYQFANTLHNRQNLAGPTSEFLGIATIAGLLWYGGSMVLIEQTLTGGAFITFMALSYQILTPAKAISKATYRVRTGNASAQRILEIIDEESPLEDHKKSINKNDFNSSIELKNIDFKYEDDYVLSDFNLTIPKGANVALVGQSGSGKSTIANLISRFYDVNNGSILIDGVDIRNIKKQSLRKLIGLVTQDSILFNDSIRNNVAISDNAISDEEIIEALKVANAWEFVSKLPDGIHTNVGDSGNKLSGGQKQRISIARAVLKNPPIMVLDEATSALDTESEHLVQKALENMMKNRTSIVIAHRLSTIQNADTIIVMQQGQIIEKGSHEELIEKKGAYNTLINMQSLNS